MKKQAVVLLFAALLSVTMAATTSWGFNCTVTLSEQQWQCEEVISLPELTQPLNFIFPNDSVIAEYGIKICLQTRVGLAHPSRWSEDSCTFYQANAPITVAPVTAPVTTPEAAPVTAPVTAPVATPVAVPVTEPVAEPKPAFAKRAAVNGIKNLLPSGKYVLGVAFVQPPNGNYSHTLNFGLTGQSCDATTVGSTCSYVAVKFSWNATVPANLGVDAQDYFLAPISTVLYGSVSIKTNSSVGLHLRRDGYPFVEENQWSSNDANSQNGELTLNNPAPGDYFIVALNNVNDTVDFSLVTSVKVCNGSANEAGPDCSQQVVPLGVADGQLLKGTASSSMSYFKLNVDGINKTRLAFSVASLDTSKPSPQVFVRWGNLPDTNNYDFVGCSTQYCAVSQVDLEVLAGSYGDWYIGVVAANGTDKDDFGIWHGAVCANNCTGDHGTCNVSGDKMGTCSCTEHFASVDCSVTVSNGLSPEMIVLIVMGALVVVSAVIGFIAWAYMRRKRGYDEIQ